MVPSSSSRCHERVQLLPSDTGPAASSSRSRGPFFEVGHERFDDEDRAPLTTSSALETDMGKYVLGWILGVPAIVLVILYLFFH